MKAPSVLNDHPKPWERYGVAGSPSRYQGQTSSWPLGFAAVFGQARLVGTRSRKAAGRPRGAGSGSACQLQGDLSETPGQRLPGLSAPESGTKAAPPDAAAAGSPRRSGDDLRTQERDPLVAGESSVSQWLLGAGRRRAWGRAWAASLPHPRPPSCWAPPATLLNPAGPARPARSPPVPSPRVPPGPGGARSAVALSKVGAGPGALRWPGLSSAGRGGKCRQQRLAQLVWGGRIALLDVCSLRGSHPRVAGLG